MSVITYRFLFVLGLLGWAAAAASADEGPIAITGATVHTLGDAGVIANATVLVKAGRIERVGNDVEIPAGYGRVDATGSVVTPGLIESSSQLGLVEIGGESTTVDARLSAYPLGPGFDVRYALNSASMLLAVNRRDGVTRAIVGPVAGTDPFAGWGVAVQLGAGEMLTHTDIGLFGNVGVGSVAYAGGSRSALIQRVRRALSQAPAYRANRYQPGPGDYSHQDMEGLKRFSDGDAPLVMNVHRANEIREVVMLAAEFERELIVVGGTEAWKVAGLLAEFQVPVVINVLANTPANYDRLGARLDNAALLEAAGVRVLMTGGDSHNARLLRQMAGNAVAHGMSWEGALAAITRAPGEVWPFASGTGTLVAGAPADLVIWSGDPLEVSSWAERVMIDGVWQDMSSRQTKLFERYRDLSSDDFYYQ